MATPSATPPTMPDTPHSVRIPIRAADDHDNDYYVLDENNIVDTGAATDNPGEICSNSSNSSSSNSNSKIICSDAKNRSRLAVAAFYLGPLSPERAPGYWMVLNAFLLLCSLSLGIYLNLLYFWYGNNETAASLANMTDFLLYSLLTTLVWIVEISLRAAFPGLDTFLVVGSVTGDPDDVPNSDNTTTNNTNTTNKNNYDDDDGNHRQFNFRRTYTAEESAVTLETTLQKRSKKYKAAIFIELLLAVYFGIETTLVCWKHWHHRHGGQAVVDEENYDFGYDDQYDNDNDNDKSDAYSMLEQQADIWINVLAYAYMTYETYHEYYRYKTTSRDIQRSMSSTLLHHQRHHQQQQQQQQQHQQQQQQQQSAIRIATKAQSQV